MNPADVSVTESMPTVVVVDDDPEIRELVATYLRSHNYVVHTAADGVQMYRLLESESVQLVLLDIMLPGTDGLALCRELRSSKNVSIIMLTALAEESDRVIGLEMGADDYLVKPFGTRELLARIRAVLRRSRDALPVHQLQHGEAYEFAEWQLQPDKRELLNAQGSVVSLTGGEFDLLLAFVRNAGKILDRDLLLELTKGRRTHAFDRAVDVQISRLRKKLDSADWIKTVRGGGYLFAPAVKQLSPSLGTGHPSG